MAKKHLAAVSLLIVLIFGLTSCVCRSSDTAISMPVYDKPASATANNRTMQDETATKSSSEKSSEATTESAQSEDASALIFPNPCSEQFDLSERDAVLFDAAVAARNRTPNADICIPEIGVYGTYVPYKIGKLQIQGFSEPTTPKNKITELSHYAEGRPVKTTGGLFAWKARKEAENF